MAVDVDASKVPEYAYAWFPAVMLNPLLGAKNVAFLLAIQNHSKYRVIERLDAVGVPEVN